MIQQLLETHVLDPKNPNKLFDLAVEYDRLEQGAMAVSLYLKAADLSSDNELQYQCMIGIALCYDRQRDRGFTVEGALFDAIALCPNKPDAHYYLCKYYESKANWKHCLMHANTALAFHIPEEHDLNNMLFYQALSKWYITGQQVGKHLIFDLKFRRQLNDELTERVNRIASQIGYPDTIPYSIKDLERFKFPFQSIETIQNNYSKHFQDMFVLALYDGKKNGTWLEIGSGDPYVHNNTALLEEFGWKGISIDNSEALCYKFREERYSTVINVDATDIAYNDLLEKHSVDPIIDYLQIDCDEASLDILKKIPFDRYKFGAVTLEHDSYRLGTYRRDEMRTILKEHGYRLLVPNVSFTESHPYEDWFIHPDLIKAARVDEMKSDKENNFIWDYFINPIEDTEK